MKGSVAAALAAAKIPTTEGGSLLRRCVVFYSAPGARCNPPLHVHTCTPARSLLEF